MKSTSKMTSSSTTSQLYNEDDESNKSVWEGHEDSLRKLLKQAESVISWSNVDFPEEWKSVSSYPPLFVNQAVLAVVPQGRLGMGVCSFII